MLEVRLIGAVEAVQDGEPVALPGMRVRALLAMLALSAGRAVSVDTLARGIWDDDPPDRVRGSLQTYVGRLRRVLGDDLIETARSGYVLRVPRSAVDMLAFADAVDAAANAADPVAERAALTDALAQWTGEPFGTPPSDWLGRHEVTAWTERYLQAFERKVDLDLRASDHRDCIVELNAHAERHPLRETLWVRLLIALDDAGRTAEALERYEILRKRLVEELGADPSTELRTVYAALLAKADEPVMPAPAVSNDRRPQQLPPRLHGFVGRDDILEALDRVAHDADGGVVVALHGPAGSGKTSVAVGWAQSRLDRFPDGQLYVNLCGYGPGEPATPDETLDQLLRNVGVAPDAIPSDVEERGALLRSVLSTRQMLVLLDNARDESQVRPLLVDGPSVTVVTSRNQLRSLVVRDGAVRIGVDQMPLEESVRMLEQRLGDGHWAADLAELAEHCGRLPIALAVAAERVDRDGPGRLEEFNAQLRDREQRLHALSTSDDPMTNVRAVLESSYRALDDDIALVFRAVGTYEHPHVAASAIAAIAALDVRDAELRLDRLVGHNLMTSLGAGRYACHDLLRDLAVELGVSTMPDQVNADAMDRLRNWCLASARNASQMISPPRSTPVGIEVLDGVTPQSFDSALAAHEWLDRHSSYLLQVVEEGNATGDPVGYHLARELFAYLNFHARLPFSRGMYEKAERSAGRAGATLAQAECANCLGAVYSDRGEYDSALAIAHRTRDLYAQAGEPSGVVKAELNIALTLSRLGQVDESITRYETAIDSAHEQGLTLSYTMGLADVAAVYLTVGRTDDARHAAAAAVAGLRDSGNLRALAHALEQLGEAQAADHRGEEAIRTYEESADLVHRLGAAAFEAATLRSLGGLYRDAGRATEARLTWGRALDLLAGADVTMSVDVSRDELVTLLDSLD